MNSILVVFTGGTIGCSPPDAGGVKDLALPADILPLLASGDVFMESIEPLRTLSENMTVEKWNTLITALKGVDFSRYLGVVIAHGTDTLAYTSALLGILLSHVPVPVVLVSSSEPLSCPTADGHRNFDAALRFILCGQYKGVYVTCPRGGHRTAICLAARLKQSQPFIDRHDSYNGIDFAVVEHGMLTVTGTEEAEKRRSAQPMPGTPYLHRLDKLEPCVLMIEPYVGLDYTRYSLKGVRAVLHGLYHSFTCCVDGGTSSAGGTSSIQTLLDLCRGEKVDLFFSPYGSPDSIYASTHALRAMGERPPRGARFLTDPTLELSYAKLLIGYALFDSEEERDAFWDTAW